MTFEEILDQAIAMLQRRGRVTYRTLKLQFSLDDDHLEALKDELLYAHPHVVDDNGRGLVWTGEARPTLTPGSPPATDQERVPLSYTPAHLTEKILDARQSLQGERKQVTVLFADLKGSMELLADRDPEEARQLLDPVLERMMAAVHRYEGTVNQVLGDGIMALFGAPIAHEDHAVRACYAALAMQEAIRRYSEEVRRTHGIEVQIRVGLNSGEVVVRAIDSDLHMDYTALGQTTHLAARMEQLAPPGTIRLTGETLRLAEGFIQVKALGLVPVKGLAEPVEVFELVGAGPLRTRLQAAAARGLTRFVGRDTELEALRQALERAGAGRGQVVAVVGEPGVGKSRLIYEFLRSHRIQGWLILESSSVSYGRATPYLPVIELLKAYFGIEPRDEARRVREKVTGKLLILDEALRPALPAFLALLDVVVEDAHWQALDPSLRRQRTLDALKRLLLRESQVQPLLLVFEDLHWIDAETQTFLDDLLVDSLPTAHILLLVNYRPEYQHPWGSKSYYTQLRLDPLPPASAEEFLQALLGNGSHLQPLKQLLLTRTQGNPFFLEESVRTLVETRVLVGERGAHRLAQEVAGIQVPATVQAILAARIDRLPPQDKHLLQTAAVLGMEVSFVLLQAIAEDPEETLHRGLTHLQAAEFLYETRLFPEREYTFKHALTHEVAYGSLLQERRRVLHARIVEAIEALYSDRQPEQVERLAHHALRGEVWRQAVRYYRQAGAKAFGRSANREAVTCFEQALSALQHLPESRETLRETIDLRFDLRNPLWLLGELVRVFEHLREAESLAEMLDDQQRLGWISAYMSNSFLWMGDYDRAMASGLRALTIAESIGDFALQVTTNFFLGMIDHSVGNYRRAMDFLGRTITALQGDLVRERFGLPVLLSVVSRTWSAWCLAESGAFTEGLTRGEEGIRIAEAVDQPSSVIFACMGLGYLYLRQGDPHSAMRMLERGLRLCQVGNIRRLFPQVASPLGLVRILSGQAAEALPLLEQAVEEAGAISMIGHQSLWIAYLSEAHLLAGRIGEATRLAERAFEHARTHKERGHEAWVLRLLGEIRAYGDPPNAEEAEQCYCQALALVEELGMRPLQAHCHLGLGKLYGKSGRYDEARAELTAAIALYRAMEMTFWLPETERALAAVEGR